MRSLWEILNERLIADGAMCTQLAALGLEGECPEAWNVDEPGAVERVHKSYVEAGARLILTNTFGATEWKLARSGHAADAERFCRAAVENALRAAAGRAYVLGDVGPTGELAGQLGERSAHEFESVFAAQVRHLVKAGVHGIMIETMSSAAEAVAAVRAAKRSCELPVFACMTYSGGRRGYRTMMGETPAEATGKLLEAGADVVGANCGLGAAEMGQVVREIAAATAGPIIAKPNAGLPRLVGDKTVFAEGAGEWAGQTPAIVEAGANIIGGCCGTTPEHIARACELLAEA